MATVARDIDPVGDDRTRRDRDLNELINATPGALQPWAPFRAQ
jgi:hypothetical protein